MKITTILPVSRTQYLDRVLESLVKQTHKPNNLLVIFDGDDKDYAEVRNKIVSLKFEMVLCIRSRSNTLAFNIPDRRLHIVALHQHFKEIIDDTDWIFSIEDDGILPPDALERLVKVVENNDDVGMATGVELGRWGLPYVGAWRVDNVNDLKEITSIENHASETPFVEEIDASGLYCALIRAGKYKVHEFTARNGLGPDVNLGLFLRKEGYHNYIDWGIHVTHLNFMNGKEIEISPLDESKIVKMKLLHGNIWSLGH